VWITEHITGMFIYGRKNSKEFGWVMLADSGQTSTVTSVAVSSGSTNLSPSITKEVQPIWINH